MQTVCHCLRGFYIIAVARIFHLNKLKKLGRIVKCHRVFQKIKKTHGQFSRLKCFNIRNTVIEIKATKNTLLTKNKVDASTPGHPRPLSTILFHIFLLAGSQENIKKCLLRPRLPLRLRHLILLFGRKINTYVPKNKNKNKSNTASI